MKRALALLVCIVTEAAQGGMHAASGVVPNTLKLHSNQTQTPKKAHKQRLEPNGAV